MRRVKAAAAAAGLVELDDASVAFTLGRFALLTRPAAPPSPALTAHGTGTPTTAVYSARPITPGAVVICPRRAGVERLSQLTDAELLDFFGTARVTARLHSPPHARLISCSTTHPPPRDSRTI